MLFSNRWITWLPHFLLCFLSCFILWIFFTLQKRCYVTSAALWLPQLLILQLYRNWPDAESEVLQEEVQHVGAAGQIVKVYVEVFVEVYAHAIWIFVVFWSDLVARLEVSFRLRMRDFLTVGSSSGSVQALG